MPTAEDTLARRQLLQAGAATVALVATSRGCRSAPPGALGDAGAGFRTPDARARHDAAADARVDASRDAELGTDATRAADSRSCVQTDYTRPVSILAAGIAVAGTATSFFDDRYLDPVCAGSRILVIHPTTGAAYVAMSGVCTHLCCELTGGEGGPSYVATYALPDGGALEDIVLCTCHGALFSAKDGSVISGPAGTPLGAGLEVLPTCEGGGFVFVTIPARPS